MKPRAPVRSWGGYHAPAQQSFRNCWWAWPLQKCTKLDFCMVNLYKPEPLCETYPQPREASNQSRRIHILWQSDYKYAHAHTDSQRMKTLNPVSITLPAERLEHLHSSSSGTGKPGPWCTVDSVFKFICYLLEHAWSKLLVGREITYVQNLLRVTETIFLLLNNDQVHWRRGVGITPIAWFPPLIKKGSLFWFDNVSDMTFVAFVLNTQNNDAPTPFLLGSPGRGT